MLKDLSELFIAPAPLNVMGIEENMTDDENISYLSMALDFCREGQQFTYKLMSQLITEDSCVNEMFEENSFVVIIKSIINFFIEKLKELVGRFLYVCNKFVGNKATIEKYSQQILAYDKPIHITEFKHFRFTNLDANIPPLSLNSKFMAEHKDLLDHLYKIGRETDKDKLVKDMVKYSSEVRNQSKDMIYAFRGEVIGKRTEISAERYSEELYKVFRNDQTSPSYAAITPQEITEAFRRYKNHKILTEGVKKQEREIKANAESIKKNIRDIKLIDVTNGRIKVDYELESNLNTILQYKCEQIANMCTVMTLAFSAKLDAIKDAIEQDKRILFAVIAEILGYGEKPVPA